MTEPDEEKGRAIDGVAVEDWVVPVLLPSSVVAEAAVVLFPDSPP